MFYWFIHWCLCPWGWWLWAQTSWCSCGSVAGWNKIESDPESCSCWQMAWCSCIWLRTGFWSRRAQLAECAPPGTWSLWGEMAGSLCRTLLPPRWSSSPPCPVSPQSPWTHPGRTPGDRGCGPSDSSTPSRPWKATGSRGRLEPCHKDSSLLNASVCLNHNTPCGFAGFLLQQSEKLVRTGRRPPATPLHRYTTPSCDHLAWATLQKGGKCPHSAAHWCRWGRGCCHADY